jgi:hypothetical protein
LLSCSLLTPCYFLDDPPAHWHYTACLLYFVNNRMLVVVIKSRALQVCVGGLWSLLNSHAPSNPNPSVSERKAASFFFFLYKDWVHRPVPRQLIKSTCHISPI